MNELSDAEIATIGDHLCEVHRKMSLSHAITVGRIVVEKLFGGDIERWKKKGASDASVRRLAERLSADRPVQVSSTLLYRGIQAYVMDRSLKLRSLPGVTLSHALAVKSLDPAAQRHWLDRVGKDGLSVAKLKVAMGLAQAKPTPIGRRAVDALDKKAQQTLDAIDAAPADERAALYDELERVAKRTLADIKARRAPAPVVDTPAAVVVDVPAELPPEPEPPPTPAVPDADFVLVGSAAAAAELERAAPDLSVEVCSLPLAGFAAPDEADLHAFLRRRWPDLPAHSRERVDSLEFPPDALTHLLHRAERGGRLHLAFDAGLTGALDLCVAAELVAERPELARRTTVDLGEVVPFADALPTVRAIWTAFRTPGPEAWTALRVPRFAGAVATWLRELPHVGTGRAASQDRLLRAARDGESVQRAIRAVVSLGALGPSAAADGLVDLVLAGLIDGPSHLYPQQPSERKRLLAQPLRLTALGEEVWAGADLLLHALDRWWGGTAITPATRWRFDPATGRVVEAPGST